ncbi:uncharacterized protein MONOS_8283 [Monocercomonoides exilis]|uniref:uncharacterized protein n=1 Tax=Monocercomonoides exilis TaxID=2049356 RepID=UPI00355A9786|nr:hypothetical protein MONOS_8283 [Monocercomonoides exilis]|eukprot:MONOS_8283.1-p1 / transcript=MONOS_8283.1 / gene=MONOS_8283 / organism=Monocercomonoides_exilis_PA203 / gene_product=unspecified product / transcript_product=unspecified product / location=Mono_scaffold00308:48227-51341(+) / protein_length=685 / sequence_SO=supercontig / SO=protein_coding / is_pseudo=false
MQGVGEELEWLRNDFGNVRFVSSTDSQPKGNDTYACGIYESYPCSTISRCLTQLIPDLVPNVEISSGTIIETNSFDCGVNAFTVNGQSNMSTAIQTEQEAGGLPLFSVSTGTLTVRDFIIVHDSVHSNNQVSKLIEISGAGGMRISRLNMSSGSGQSTETAFSTELINVQNGMFQMEHVNWSMTISTNSLFSLSSTNEISLTLSECAFDGIERTTRGAAVMSFSNDKTNVDLNSCSFLGCGSTSSENGGSMMLCAGEANEVKVEETAKSENITCETATLNSVDKVRGYDNENTNVAIPLCIYLLPSPEEIYARSTESSDHSHCGIVQFPSIQLQYLFLLFPSSSYSPSSSSSSLSSLSSLSSSSFSSSSSSSSISSSPSLTVSTFASVSATSPIFPAPAITQTTTSMARIHSSTAHRFEISTSNTSFSTTFTLATLRSFFDDTSSSVSASLLAPTIVLGGSSTESIAFSSSSSSSSSSSLPPLSSSASSSLASLTSPTSLASSSFSALLSFSHPIQQMSTSTSPGPALTRQPQPSSQTRTLSTRTSSATSQQSLTQASSPSLPSHLAHPGSLQQSTAVATPTTSSNLPAAVTSSAIISTTSSSSLSSALSAPLFSSATDAPLLLGTYSPSSHTSSQKRFFYSPPRLFKFTTHLDDVPHSMPSSHSSHKRSSSSHQEMRRSMELH